MFFSRPARSDAEFSVRCRQALADARVEAIRLGHEHIGPEHVLLALAAMEDSGGARLLVACGADLADVRRRVEIALRSLPRATASVAHDKPADRFLPYTSRAKRALESAMTRARNARNPALRSEHLLLGLLADAESIAARVLAEIGVTIDRAVLLSGTIGDADTSKSEGTARANTSAPESGATREFRVIIDDRSDRSIFEQIVGQVQEAVATGQLQEGDRLPPVRQLADTLGIATGTVARAYAELERLGVVITEGARGTRVAPRPPRVPAPDRPDALVGLLRPVVVAAYHLGAAADELRAALATAMQDIFSDLADDRPNHRG
ncbi:MAG TPA: Clp protease N-terminal domain-containing protein [Gemmatimonas sp.]|nr:Clp protease N-terminal domain-containing protein [Gemmatimonas sp.]